MPDALKQSASCSCLLCLLCCACLLPLPQGKLVVQQGKVNLRNVADDVIDLCSALAKPGVSLRNKIPASTVAVSGPGGT